MIIGNNINTAFGLFGTCSLMILALFSTFPAVKAYMKGRNFVKWYLFSVLLFPVAFVASFMIRERENSSLLK